MVVVTVVMGIQFCIIICKHAMQTFKNEEILKTLMQTFNINF